MYQKPIDDKTKERFWSKVDKRGPDECWEWMQKGNEHGYGRPSINGKRYYAHRFSWMICNGDIPKGMLVCHHCDNPKCVNPNHLFLGTQLDNIRDAKRKNRMVSPNIVGENNPSAKLTEQQVLEIRGNYRPGVYGYGLQALARQYGVHKKTILDIIKRNNWSHI